ARRTARPGPCSDVSRSGGANFSTALLTVSSDLLLAGGARCAPSARVNEGGARSRRRNRRRLGSVSAAPSASWPPCVNEKVGTPEGWTCTIPRPGGDGSRSGQHHVDRLEDRRRERRRGGIRLPAERALRLGSDDGRRLHAQAAGVAHAHAAHVV